MKTFYIPLHFYEQAPGDDELVMFVTQRDMEDAEFSSQLTDVVDCYSDQLDTYPSVNDMVDDIFDSFAEKINAVWSYCKTILPLVIGEPEQRPKKKREMKAVSATELAALLIKLKPGESMDFYETYDEESGVAEGAYGAAMVNRFEAYAIYINYYGGGIPFVVDVSVYDTDLKRLEEDLLKYFNDMENPCGHVYVDTGITTSVYENRLVNWPAQPDSI